MSATPISIFDVPDAALAQAFNAAVSRVVRWVDIYEADNTTAWRREVPLTSGSVSVDSTRSERRNLDLELVDIDGQLPHGPDGLWYDKIIKPYTGIEYDGIRYATCLGEFMIDKLERPHFPHNVKITGRDFTKKLLLSTFTQTTTFTVGQPPETIIRTIASNAGISKFALSPTGQVTGEPYTFERNTVRWKAIEALADAAAHEAYFDNFGYLVLRPLVDPLTAPLAHSFKTGQDGNLVSFQKVAEDTRLRNHVVVYGDRQANPLVFAEAENVEPSSPTQIAKIGRRTHSHPTKFIESNADAQLLADRLLRVMALEQYDITMDAISAPWLEAGDAVEFLDPNPGVNQPTRFLLSSFTISLGLGPMSVNAKRIHVVT